MNVAPEQPNEEVKPKRSFAERIKHNFREVVAMFLYLWLLFALFTFHKSIVLAEHNIDFKPFGIAIFNAFVLAKIMLIAEEMNLATRFRRRAPIFPILHKSFLFAIILVVFTIVEHLVIGWWKGKGLSESMPKFGSGSVIEILLASVIIAIALIPFFAFRELSRVMGKGVLGTLLLRNPQELARLGQLGKEHKQP